MLCTDECGVTGLCQQLPDAAHLPSGTVRGLGEEGPELLYPAAVAAVPMKSPPKIFLILRAPPLP